MAHHLFILEATNRTASLVLLARYPRSLVQKASTRASHARSVSTTVNLDHLIYARIAILAVTLLKRDRVVVRCVHPGPFRRSRVEVHATYALSAPNQRRHTDRQGVLLASPLIHITEMKFSNKQLPFVIIGNIKSRMTRVPI